MTFKNLAKHMVLLVITLSLTSIFIFSVSAQEEDDDPVIFIIGEGSTYVGDKGWYAGYVICGQSGTYKLNISATGGERQHYPITNVKVIVLASKEAANGGLKSLSIEGMSIKGFREGVPPYYRAKGGPFKEPDYYGYNDTYKIQQLTYDQVHHPKSIQITVIVEFGPTATANSKIMFLCYGTDAKGKPAETPFSGATMFVIPDLASTLTGLTAFGSAYGLYCLRKRKMTKT